MRFVFALFLLLGCATHRPIHVVPPDATRVAAPTLITGVDVFTGLDDFLTRQVDVLLVDGRVRAIVPTGKHELEGKVEMVEGRGRVLLPGFADMHVLIGGRGEVDPREALEKLLSQGVTSAVVVGHDADLERLQQQIASGALAGPRLYRSTRPIHAPGAEGLYPMRATQEADSPREAARAARRDLERLRSDFVRIDVGEGFSEAMAKAAVAEAGAYKKPVFASAPSSEGAAVAAEAGVALLLSPPWEDELDKEQAQRIALSGVPVVSALGLCPEGGACADNLRANLGHLAEAGVPILGGSGVGTGGEDDRSLAKEVEALVAMGMRPADALLAITSHPVRLLDPTAKFGVVSPGAYADLVLVEGDPLEDPSALQNVVEIWQAGRRLEMIR